jgi:hypothetical protein
VAARINFKNCAQTGRLVFRTQFGISRSASNFDIPMTAQEAVLWTKLQNRPFLAEYDAKAIVQASG